MKCRTSAVKRLCVWLGCLLVVCPVLSRSFIHPGVLHTKERMKQIRALVKEKNEDAYASYLLLEKHPCAQADYNRSTLFRVTGSLLIRNRRWNGISVRFI